MNVGAVVIRKGFGVSRATILNASRRPPRPGRKQRGAANCWCQFITAAHRRTERLKGWDERQKTKREGGEEKLDGGGKRRGKQAIKLESRLRNSILKTGRK